MLDIVVQVSDEVASAAACWIDKLGPTLAKSSVLYVDDSMPKVPLLYLGTGPARALLAHTIRSRRSRSDSMSDG